MLFTDELPFTHVKADAGSDLDDSLVLAIIVHEISIRVD